MDDLFREDEGISIEELLHIGACLGFGEFFLDFLAKIAVAELGDDVGVVLGGVDFVQGENIGVLLHVLEDFDF